MKLYIDDQKNLTEVCFDDPEYAYDPESFQELECSLESIDDP